MPDKAVKASTPKGKKEIRVTIEKAANGFIVRKDFFGPGMYMPPRPHVFSDVDKALAMIKDCMAGKHDTEEKDYGEELAKED